MLKEWLRSGKQDLQAKSLFDSAALDVEKQLVKTSPGGLTYFAEYKYGRLEHKMDELACFGGGMYGLAAHKERDENSDRWMRIADGITTTCHEAFDRADTKLAPEIFRFSDSVEARAVITTERHYILRPETFESYFYMWRLTKDQKYRDWGWEAVQAIETHCKAAAGYTGIKNVYDISSQKDDVQQSFLLAESFKVCTNRPHFKFFLYVCLLRGHCQSSQFLNLNCWIQKACAVIGLLMSSHGPGLTHLCDLEHPLAG